MPAYPELNDQIVKVLVDAGRPLMTSEIAERLQAVVAGRQPTIDTVANRLRALFIDEQITRDPHRIPSRWSPNP